MRERGYLYMPRVSHISLLSGGAEPQYDLGDIPVYAHKYGEISNSLPWSDEMGFGAWDHSSSRA